MKKILISVGTILAFSAAVANAQTMVTDTDGDGVYSIEEMTAAYPDMTAETFATIDANADGMVDADELSAAVEAGVIPA